MFSSDDDSQGVVMGVLFGVIALVIGLVIGVAVYQSDDMQTPPQATVQAAPADADGARVVVEGDVVKFYFATGKSELASGASEALAAVVKGVTEGKTAVVSGFHDATGDAAQNEELAKQRAFAVRDALTALGVAQDKVELQKPEVPAGSGDDAEARRVEVSLK